MAKMQKPKSNTSQTVTYDRKVKCSCPGCGIEFPKSKGIKGQGDVSEHYCTREHADIAQIINRGK